MSKPINELNLIQIKKNNIFKGTGFLINKAGYFLTAKHNIDLDLIDDYVVVYNSKDYKIRRIKTTDYNYIDIDLINLKADIKLDNYFIPIYNEKNLEINQNDELYTIGYFKNDSEKIEIQKYKLNFIKRSNSLLLFSKKDIPTGISGSPIIYKNKAIGVFNGFDKSLKYEVATSSEVLTNKNFNIKEDIRTNLPKFCQNINIIFLLRYGIKCKNTLKIISSLHNLEHIFIKQEDKISKKDISPDTAIEIILKEYKKIFDNLAQDVSIHLKMFSKYYELRTYLRIPSKNEISYAKKASGRERSSDEVFKIFRKTIKELKEEQPTIKHKVNSAYNEVCFSNKKLWLCNDLKKSEKSNLYYSTSQDYEKYYNALAVFALSNRNNNNIDMKGLLIIDSKYSYSFNYDCFRELGGYLTHKLYRFMNYNLNNEFDTCPIY